MRVLHVFNWQIKHIIEHLDKFKVALWDALLISTLQPLMEDTLNEHFCFWHPYQPVAFQIGNVFGTKEELILLCNEAHKRGIKIIADVVLNHTAGRQEDTLLPHAKVEERLTSNPFFWKEKKLITNWDDRYQVTHYCMGLPGLEVSNYDLQAIMFQFLNEYIACGVDGFRFDAAKCIATPSEGCDFWPRMLEHLDRKDLVLCGEILNPKSMTILWEYSNYIDILTEAPRGIPLEKTFLCTYSHDNHFSDLPGMNLSYKSDEQLRREYVSQMNWPNIIYFPRNGLVDAIHPEIVSTNEKVKQLRLGA